eukprot:COSAG06_NODE_4775_length_3962_cov_2.636552_1_plen_58_part_00
MRPRKREVTSPFLTKARVSRREVVEGRRREVERREGGRVHRSRRHGRSVVGVEAKAA